MNLFVSTVVTSLLRSIVVPSVPLATHWRVMVNDSDNFAFTSISELEFRLKPGGTDVTREGYAIEGGHYSVREGSRAFDNTYFSNEWSYEYTDGLADAWVGQEFPIATTIEEIEMSSRDGTHQDHTPTDFDIQYSTDDGVTWTTYWSEISTGWSSSESRVFTNPTYAAAPYAVIVEPAIGDVDYLHGFPTGGVNVPPEIGTNNIIFFSGGGVSATGRFTDFGAYFNFIGEGCYVSSNNAFDFTGDWTYELWIKPWDDNTGSSSRKGGYSIYSEGSQTDIGTNIYFDQGGAYDGRWVFSASSDNSVANEEVIIFDDAGSPTLDTWLNVAVVRNGDLISLYLDGERIGLPVALPTGFVQAKPSGGSRFNYRKRFYSEAIWRGYLDDIRHTTAAVYTEPHYEARVATYPRS